MKKLLIIAIFSYITSAVHAQIVIPSTTTINTMRTLAAGNYVFYSGTDTVKYTACTPFTIIRHDTLKITTTIIQKVDSAAIQALKVCPIVPICPPTKQRTAISIVWDIILNTKTVIYDTGEKTVL